MSVSVQKKTKVSLTLDQKDINLMVRDWLLAKREELDLPKGMIRFEWDVVEKPYEPPFMKIEVFGDIDRGMVSEHMMKSGTVIVPDGDEG